ncbi:hypothetical protein HMPREF0578_1173 [Mobiluncus mulieris 28-1]|nr:hypothetical protein HMPREF0578_1173 [Mobiluncus mulieris 28-1]
MLAEMSEKTVFCEENSPQTQRIWRFPPRCRHWSHAEILKSVGIAGFEILKSVK